MGNEGDKQAAGKTWLSHHTPICIHASLMEVCWVKTMRDAKVSIEHTDVKEQMAITIRTFLIFGNERECCKQCTTHKHR